jgi:hypothetical protein
LEELISRSIKRKGKGPTKDLASFKNNNNGQKCPKNIVARFVAKIPQFQHQLDPMDPITQKGGGERREGVPSYILS